MKRVLVIAYYWPPSGGSGVQRWVKFAKYLPAEGWQPVVYTPSNPSAPATDASLATDIPSCVEVIRRPIREVGALLRRSSAREVNPINHQRKSLAGRLMMWVRGNCFIPDPRRGWVGPSVRFLRKYLREHPVDAIVTTGPPHSMHLIGLKLSRQTGLPWVADFRDPWTKIFYFKHLHLSPWAVRRHQALERAVLDGATRVVAVSPPVAEEFRAMTATPVELITNGFDPEDYAGTQTPSNRLFRLIHTGLFAADGNPVTLWKVLADKCLQDSDFAAALRITLAGKTDPQILAAIRQAGLGEVLDDRGYCDHTAVVRMQQEAAVLLLPLRQEPEYRNVLPGKLFEYLGARRPVLGIGQPDGAMATVLKDAGAGQTFDWDDPSGLRGWLDAAWTAFRAGTLAVDARGLEAYSRVSTARKMAALLDQLKPLRNE